MSGTLDESALKAQLPWLVNGSLQGEERVRLETAMAGQPGLRAEQEFLQRLRDAVRAPEVAGPGELGWRRLRRQIEAETSQRAAVRQRRGWQGLALAASVLLAVQGVWFHGTGPVEGVYEPMGTAPATAGIVLQVRFSKQASVADVQALLQRHGLRLVAGPGAAGVWRLGVPAGDAAAAETALRAETALVEFVAPDR